MLNLRKNNEALSANASFKKKHFGDDKAIYVYIREKGNKKVLVILNFSGSEQNVAITDATLTGKAHNVFKEKKRNFKR